ncbi:deoxycytidine triphosphate deaminase [Lysobacteraceae bacterium NML93-0399]|nr:deoxycytidine triphosphate deaminase [Xanthomonadaceae bacterium NML93-0399]
MTDATPALPDDARTRVEAAAFRRLLSHLNEARPDVQNIDLMILAGFCRNCLGDWYRDAAADEGVSLDKDAAREAVYGMPFAHWKAQHQKTATPEQLAAFEAAQKKHAR